MTTKGAIGLRCGSVQLLEYDPAWAELFEAEKKLLTELFGDDVVAIEHIGSTAIPGMSAKPIIDMNVALTSIENIDKYVPHLEKLGYVFMSNRRFIDRWFFPKGAESLRTHHLNLVELDSETGWEYPLLFRDYLNTHSQDFERYKALKLDLASKHSEDRDSYTEAKGVFVREILDKTSQ